MSLHPAIALYDPRRLSEADFLAGFIARGDLAAHLLDRLRQTVADGDARHRLILGTRGMGKTSLLRRVAIGIAQDPALRAALLPLTFREEQYNVRSLDQLWRNCGEALAEWLEVSGDAAGAAALDRALEGPDWRGVEQAGAAFAARMAGMGRRAVLLLDNLDLILDALPEDQHWQWRRHLQAAGGPVVIAAATQAPRQLGDRDAAFYEFFRLDRLDPLTEAELFDCLRRLAGLRAEAGRSVLAVLRQDPGRLRVLHTLTGGNPRILILLYQLLERAESDTVFEDLEALLDQVTPLYKARVEELRTDMQRAMLDAVALHWDPITANGLAKATGEPVTTVSSQLSRLREAGYVEEVPTSGTRNGYQLVERFFNVWYLMRHGTRRTKQRMRWLTAFLRSFFSMDELRGMRARLAPDAASLWHPLYAEALEAALESAGAKPRARPSERTPDATAFWAAFSRAHDAAAAGDAAAAERGYREAIALDPRHAWPWHNLGNLLQDHLGRYDEAEQAYREAIARDPKDAHPWNNLGNLLQNRFARHEEAERAYREAIARDPKDAHPWNNLGNLLQDHFARHEEAEQAYREAIARDPKYAPPWNGLGNLLQDHLGRYEEAEQAYREAIARDPKYFSPWNGLGNLLQDHLGRHDEAEQAYREAIARDPNNFSVRANLLWLRLETSATPAIAEVDAVAAALPPVGRHLLDAAFAVHRDNLGVAWEQLHAALALPLAAAGMSFLDDLLRLLRLAQRRGHGERLIALFETSGAADRHAPIHAALVALVRGEATLRDVNPEVRASAARLYAWLRPPSTVTPPAPPKKRRGRPRRAH